MTVQSMSEILDQNYTEVEGHCAIHGDWTSLAIKSRAESASCGKCHQEKIDRERKESEQKAAEERLKAKIEHNRNLSGIPYRYLSKTLNNYKPGNKLAEKALNQSRDFVNNFKSAYENGTSLIFSGNVGTGKTHLACGICNHILEMGGPVRYISFSNLVREFRDSWNKSDDSEHKVIKRFREYHLLAIDEIGAQRGTDDEKLILFDIINARYEYQMPTIIITNLSKHDLAESMGERVLDRLREGNGKLIVFDWESHRASK